MLDFLILYEHRARELENVCLLKAELECRGFSVEIKNVRALDIVQYRFWRKPKVVVTFGLRNNIAFLRHAAGIVGNHKKIVNLQWEQIGTSASLELSIPKDKATKVVHISWGEENYRKLLRAGVSKAIITGAMQMDFLTPLFKPYFKSRIEMEKEYDIPSGKMLLYISSFSVAAMTEKELEKLQGILNYDVRPIVDNQRKSKELTLKWFGKYLDETPDVQIIYRPHPGENIDDDLLEMKKSYKGFHIISEESIRPWVLAADDIITWMSTAIAEVSFAKKNCMVLRPVQIDKENDIFLYENSLVIDSYDKMVEALNTLQRPFPISLETIEYYYGKRQGEPAYVKISNLLEDVYGTDVYDITDLPWRPYLYESLKRIIKRMVLLFKIKSDKYPWCWIPFVRRWLEFFEFYWEKFEYENASAQEIDEITDRLKSIIN